MASIEDLIANKKYDGDDLDGTEGIVILEDDKPRAEGMEWNQVRFGIIRDWTFESFPSLETGQTNTGSGVYFSGRRTYIGLIPLINSGDKEFIFGQVSGARGSFARGGKIEFYAENDPFNDGLDITLTTGYVKTIKGLGTARLVEFDYNSHTWVGLEVEAGGQAINLQTQAVYRQVSQSNSTGEYPVQLGDSDISNLAAHSGNQASDHPSEIHEELSTKTIFADLGIGKDPSYQVHSAGDVAADGTVRDLSDRRVKEAIEPITEPLKRVRELEGRTYDRTDKDRHSAGLVAQDVEEAFPIAVDETGDLKTLDQGALLGLAFSAINALEQENGELRNRLNRLEQQL